MTTRSIAAACALITALLAPESGEGEGGGNSKIAFSNQGGSADIFVVNSDGTGLVNLTNRSKARETSPVWSPDGGAIAFVNDAGGFGVFPDICVMNADGSNVVNLTNDGAIDTSPSWSPDGTKICFASNRDHGWQQIFVIKRDGSDVINLTPGHGHFGSSPHWSPDGRWIAFTRRNERRVDIFVMAPDGSDVRNLTNSDAPKQNPVWSPDGSLIAFTSGRTGDECASVFVMNADGSQVRQLAECGYAPSWYPDGSQVIFEVDHDTPLQIIDVDGTNQRPLSADGPTLGHRLAWSSILAVTAVFDLTWGSVKFNQLQK